MLPAPEPQQLWFEPFHEVRLDEMLQIEQRAYAHPWQRQNFIDSVQSGYQIQLLLGERAVLGYFVAMQGVDEVHLLNLTVDPAQQGRGWGRILLEALVLWARGLGLHWLWLEVRQSNLQAQRLYEKQGFQRVGLRKDYYPDGLDPSGASVRREHAVVMSRKL